MKSQWFLQSVYEVRRRGKNEKSVEDLFERPILHRQISGDEVYIALDLARLGWNVES